MSTLTQSSEAEGDGETEAVDASAYDAEDWVVSPAELRKSEFHTLVDDCLTQ